MDQLSRHEAHYLDRFPDLDPGKVGEQIGIGAQHTVRAYGEDQVIKMPRLETMRDVVSLVVGRILTPTTDRLRKDLDLAEEYFGDHVLPTAVVLDTRHRYYCMLQPRLDSLEAVVPEHVLADEIIKSELTAIVNANRDLYAKHRVFLDMMGWNPRNVVMMRPALENVVKVPETRGKQLQLPDVTLFNPDYSARGVYFAFLREVQRANMRLGFGMDFV
jgi:hypothetical protein